MGKKKTSDNDINSILSQLKKSYNFDGDQEPEEDIFDSETTYEDTELNSLLAKIISDNSLEFEDAAFNDDEDTEYSNEKSKKATKDEKNIPESNNQIKSEDFVSVLESGEDISEGAKYSFPVHKNIPDSKSEVEQPSQPEIEIIEENDDSEPFIEESENEVVEEDGDVIFGDLEDVEDDEQDVTFGELEDDDIEDDEQDVTFGELEDDDIEDDEQDVTFGELEGDDIEDDEQDVTFGGLEDDDIEDDEQDVTFGELEAVDDESNELTVDLPSENKSEEDEQNVIVISVANEYETISDDTGVDADHAVVDIFERSSEKQNEIHVESYKEKYSELLSDDEDYTYGGAPDVDIVSVEKQEAEPDIYPVIEEQKEDESVILSSDDYTFDPLQWHFEKKKKIVIDDVPDNEVREAPKKVSEIQDEDISLLLQLGYKKELNTEVGRDRTDSVVRSISNSYRPDKDKIPFGFCGKEFSETQQISNIKQKYDADKRSLIMKSALFSAIAVVLLLLDILFKTRADAGSLIMFPIIEMIIMGLGCVMIRKELASGVKGILRFASTIFTIPIFSLIIFTIYNLFTVISTLLFPENADIKMTPLFGFICSMFFVFAIFAKLLNCIREQKTFNVIASSDDLYVGQMLIQPNNNSADTGNLRAHEIRKQIKGEAVIVKKSRFVSEYFKRNAESAYGIFNHVAIIGGVMLCAMLMSYLLIAVMHGSAADVATTVIFITYASLSSSFIITMPVQLFAASENLVCKKCGFVGSGAVLEYGEADSIIFPEHNVYAVNGDIEVVPIGSLDMNSAIKTANRLFNSLGGTLLDAAGKESFSEDTSVSTANVNIVSINNDGIELYMDADTHILFGNERFFSLYRKKLNIESASLAGLKGKEKEVLYFAINWEISLRYTVSSKIRDDFYDIGKLLSENNIRSLVYTYEPNIKAVRTNAFNIGVYRPYEYESRSRSTTHFGGLIASENSMNVVYPLLMMKEISSKSKKYSRISLIFVLAGILIACGVTLLGYLVPSVSVILKYREAFVVLMQLAGIVPVTIGAVRLFKKYKNKVKNESTI